MRNRVSVGGAVLVWMAVMVTAISSRVVTAQEGVGRKIWDGIYTEAQAARGKPAFETSCGRCHNNELVGSERAPALKGDGFFSHWENDTLDKLFTKIRDTMPAGGIESVTDAGKLDILAFVLSKNGAPAGKEELSLELPALEAITIVRQGGVPEGVSNFNLVQLVGCLAPAGDKAWKLTNASEPVVTKEETSTPAALAKAGGQGAMGIENRLSLPHDFGLKKIEQAGDAPPFLKLKQQIVDLGQAQHVLDAGDSLHSPADGC